MNYLKKYGLAALALAVVIGGLVRYGAVASSVPESAAAVHIQNVQSMNLVVRGQGSLGAGVSGPQDELLGGLVHNTQETFDAGIAVNGTEYVSSRGKLTIPAAGGASIAGYVTTTSLVTDQVTSYTSSASSQTLCSLLNSSGADRVLDQVVLTFATSTATGGSYRFTVSQASAVATTGTTLGTDLYNDIVYAAPTDGLVNLTATSTLMGSTGAKVIWRSGRFINFMIASPTTTLSGTCRATSL